MRFLHLVDVVVRFLDLEVKAYVGGVNGFVHGVDGHVERVVVVDGGALPFAHFVGQLGDHFVEGGHVAVDGVAHLDDLGAFAVPLV